MQLVAAEHETADSAALAAPDTAGMASTRQELPSHSSAAALVFWPATPVCPTAMHRAGAGQEMAVRGPASGATATIRQRSPFQDNAKESPSSALPTAMHLVRLAQDTPSKLSVRTNAGCGNGVASPCQDLPSQTSVTGLPREPTAMHIDRPRQETPDNPVATGGRLNTDRAPPAGTPPAAAALTRRPLPAAVPSPR